MDLLCETLGREGEPGNEDIIIYCVCSPACKVCITEASGVVQRVNSSYKESRNDDAHLWLMLPKLSPSPTYTKYRVFTITM